jgi:hypothetical protein
VAAHTYRRWRRHANPEIISVPRLLETRVRPTFSVRRNLAPACERPGPTRRGYMRRRIENSSATSNCVEIAEPNSTAFPPPSNTRHLTDDATLQGAGDVSMEIDYRANQA